MVGIFIFNFLHRKETVGKIVSSTLKGHLDPNGYIKNKCFAFKMFSLSFNLLKSHVTDTTQIFK